MFTVKWCSLTYIKQEPDMNMQPVQVDHVSIYPLQELNMSAVVLKSPTPIELGV